MTVVLGPLADVAVPGAFDLCAEHASRTSVPMGWEVIRLPLDRRRNEPEADDELVALANAVREIGLHDEEDILWPFVGFSSAQGIFLRQ